MTQDIKTREGKLLEADAIDLRVAALQQEAEELRRLAFRQLQAERAEEERLFLANSDRGRLKAAFAALRKAGFQAITGERPYESTNPSKLKVDKDEVPVGSYAYTYANHYKHSFTEGWGWRERSVQTLQSQLAIHYGPDEDAGRRVMDQLALAGFGDQAEWSGSYSDCVLLNPKEEVKS